MRKVHLLTIAGGCFLAVSAYAASPLSFEPVRSRSSTAQEKPVTEKSVTAPHTRAGSFTFKNARGAAVSVPVADAASQRKLTGPVAKIDPKLDPTLAKAATIAQDRANARSKSRCWRYVKQALLAAGAIDSYPKTRLAKQAGEELVKEYGFKKLPVSNPFAAPIGAVLVYTAKGAGHVEIRTKTGFVSDFSAAKPSKRRLIGVYAKR